MKNIQTDLPVLQHIPKWNTPQVNAHICIHFQDKNYFQMHVAKYHSLPIQLCAHPPYM